MVRRSFGLALALLLPISAIAQTPAPEPELPSIASLAPGLHGRIEVLQSSGAGEEAQLRIVLSWPGRPERLGATKASLQVPGGAAVRLSGTTSSFDGENSQWETRAAVTLPETEGPWTIGPATVQLYGLGPEPRPYEIAAIQIEPLRAGAEGGSPAVLLLGVAVILLLLGAGAFFVLGGAKVAPSEASQRRSALLAEAEAALKDGGASGTVAFLDAVIALRGVLPEGAGELPSLDLLRDRLDRIRFGGEEIGPAECRDLLSPLAAAARALD